MKYILAWFGLLLSVISGLAYVLFQQEWLGALMVIGIACLSGSWLMKNP